MTAEELRHECLKLAIATLQYGDTWDADMVVPLAKEYEDYVRGTNSNGNAGDSGQA